MKPLMYFSISFLFLFVAAPQSGATESDFTPSPAPSRIVLNPTESPMTSQAITWRTDAGTEDGQVIVEPAAGGTTFTVNAEAGPPVSFPGWEYQSRHHSAVITGLAADTGYRYRVGSEAGWSEWRNFRTADDGSDPWTMLYFGDAQNNLGESWRPVIEKAFAATPEAELSIHTGDLINNSSIDEEWGQWFAGLEGHADRIETMPSTGNHELSSDSFGVQFAQHFTMPENGPLLARNTVYFTDFQGVRLIALDGNGTDALGQLEFLRNALENNPNRWTVVHFHQPIFSGSVGRDNPINRAFIMPLLEQYNVDLVLQGHDHVYARGHVTENETDVPGVTDGPVYTVAVAGPKYYELSPADKNNWTDNGATRVKGYNQTSTFQPIRFDGDRLYYRSIIAAKGEGSDAPGDIGDELDSFTITKLPDGSKEVTEGIKPPENEPPAETTPAGRMKVLKLLKPRGKFFQKAVVKVTAPGRLTIKGHLAGQKSRAISPVSRKLTRSGKHTIRLVPKPQARRKAARKRKAVIKFTYRPTAGDIKIVKRRTGFRKR
ncbi:MAG: metallophosphoesterase family protein [Solirubrobacterales bacterium]